MKEIPAISGREAVRAFENAGWLQARQESSHVIMKRSGYRATLSVPQDSELAKGTLRKLIRSAEMTVEEFVCYLAVANSAPLPRIVCLRFPVSLSPGTSSSGTNRKPRYLGD